jgi:hypothetical protein
MLSILVDQKGPASCFVTVWVFQGIGVNLQWFLNNI